jgi:hypothetical protein
MPKKVSSVAATASSSQADPLYEFNIGETVLAYFGKLLYEAKVCQGICFNFVNVL